MKFLKVDIVICISKLEKVIAWAELGVDSVLVHATNSIWVYEATNGSLFQVETFQSRKVLFSRGLEKDSVWVVDKEERTYIPLQAQELQLGSGDFFHAAQTSLREGVPHSERTQTQAFR